MTHVQRRPTMMKLDDPDVVLTGPGESCASFVVSPVSKLNHSSSSSSEPQQSATSAVADEEMVSGRFFVRQLCLSDRYFAVLAEDYLEHVMADRSPQQSIHNWNIIAVCLADNGLMMNEEVLFRIMAGDAEVAAALTEDIQTMKEYLLRSAEGSTGAPFRPRWQALAPTGQKQVPLKQRLNPFVAGRESSRPPTVIHVYDADRLSKMRQLVVLQTKELENKLAKARDKKSQETRAAEAAAQQKMLEEQLTTVNLQKSDMLRLLESLEAKFGADEKKIQHIKKLTATTGHSTTSQDAGVALAEGVNDSPPPLNAQQQQHAVSAPASGASLPKLHTRSPPRIKDPNTKPFEKPSRKR